jgi:lipoprotein-anchoring transpeptidase ErfK/SrfK
MNGESTRQPIVGNDFIMPRPKLRVAKTVVNGVNPLPALSMSLAPNPVIVPTPLLLPANHESGYNQKPLSMLARAIDIMHRYTVAVFALLILIIGSTGIEVGYSYWNAHELASIKAISSEPVAAHTSGGLNMAVSNSYLASALNAITTQPASLTIGTQNVAISPSIIKSWLAITSNPAKTKYDLHLNPAVMTSSLTNLANSFTSAPVNQVTLNEAGVSQVVVAGSNGVALSDPTSLNTQSQQQAKSVLGGKGLNFSTPLKTVPFQSLTPASFNKLIDNNVTTKQSYFFQNGQLIQTFAATDGKPSTPTPLGEFHIWDKIAMQTMTGPGYVQPNVPWINYFDHDGDAIHGNYWRPASVFGNVNTSHGCVGLPVSEAEWVYNWAPIGTTVINHT